MSRSRLSSVVLSFRSPCSRTVLDLERGADGRPFYVVAHELRYGVSDPWRRRRAVALSSSEGRALGVALSDLESSLEERKPA